MTSRRVFPWRRRAERVARPGVWKRSAADAAIDYENSTRSPERPGGGVGRAANRGSDRPPDRLADLAHDAAAEQQHAGDEDRALDHRDPFSELREIILHRDDDDRAE